MEVLRDFPNDCIDMVLCDLPYGTTQNKWDSIIPLDLLWSEYWRVCKKNAAIVLTAAQPFSAKLVMSQLQNFRYDWVWHKLGKPTGHLNAKKQPLRNKEDVLVFYKEQCTYNPQMTEGRPYLGAGRAGSKQQSSNYGISGKFRNDNPGNRYPLQVIPFNRVEHPEHPTQKPTLLFEYLIRTYSNDNEVVLDTTAGSGTTAVAAINTCRSWVCIEKEQCYYDAAVRYITQYEKT